MTAWWSSGVKAGLLVALAKHGVGGMAITVVVKARIRREVGMVDEEGGTLNER